MLWFALLPGNERLCVGAIDIYRQGIRSAISDSNKKGGSEKPPFKIYIMIG